MSTMPEDELRKLSCPKCDAPMRRVQFDQVEVDRCMQCGGIWFDRNELDDLRRAQGAEVIDTGDARVGAALDAQTHVPCPVCAVPMNRVPDEHKPHIWHERCPSCQGWFLDAGEFRDLKSSDLFDLFDRLLERR